MIEIRNSGKKEKQYDMVWYYIDMMVFSNTVTELVFK